VAIQTTLQQLEEVQTAISNILTYGQAINSAGRALTNADLDALTRREKYLMDRYRSEGNQGLTANVGVMKRD
jgi:hypothetical protein